MRHWLRLKITVHLPLAASRQKHLHYWLRLSNNSTCTTGCILQAGQSFQGRSRESEEHFRAVPRHYSASTTGCVPQSDQGCSTKLEEQFKAVLRRRSEMGDVAVVSGKLPDELLDSFGSSMVLLLQPPPQSKSSTHASHSGGVPKQKGFTTESMGARPAPPSKGTRRPSLEDEDDDAVKLLEQERILFTKKGSTFSRPTEVTMMPALAAYAASGNKGRPPGQFTDPKLASSRSTRPSSEGDSLRMRKLD
ncbi:hypothetical protein DUNSADRAFT_10726 [Dunaliella salina]|uniref:Encoded protein n=1 Tax=Dunaliella salina TaxID=3046 RepID=A0ABQ7GEM6_DUNSA|nr:hypothetical protein DUNSADRAFT_10726 [Dunaliella salina]|eukprot:KAF5833062.1 hypothetical protein DUNSADRAFT_10726 [Dunaliella salina]